MSKTKHAYITIYRGRKPSDAYSRGMDATMTTFLIDVNNLASCKFQNQSAYIILYLKRFTLREDSYIFV